MVIGSTFYIITYLHIEVFIPLTRFTREIFAGLQTRCFLTTSRTQQHGLSGPRISFVRLHSCFVLLIQVSLGTHADAYELVPHHRIKRSKSAMKVSICFQCYSSAIMIFGRATLTAHLRRQLRGCLVNHVTTDEGGP